MTQEQQKIKEIVTGILTNAIREAFLVSEDVYSKEQKNVIDEVITMINNGEINEDVCILTNNKEEVIRTRKGVNIYVKSVYNMRNILGTKFCGYFIADKDIIISDTDLKYILRPCMSVYPEKRSTFDAKFNIEIKDNSIQFTNNSVLYDGLMLTNTQAEEKNLNIERMLLEMPKILNVIADLTNNKITK